eukprot:763105-Hanusia_phi.AAC.2
MREQNRAGEARGRRRWWLDPVTDGIAGQMTGRVLVDLASLEGGEKEETAWGVLKVCASGYGRGHTTLPKIDEKLDKLF